MTQQNYALAGEHSYAMQVAKAVHAACKKSQIYTSAIDGIDLAAIISVVPRPEPVGTVVDNPDDHGNRHDFGNMYEDLPNGTLLYTELPAQLQTQQPAEPVNARLLDAANNYVRLKNELLSFDQHTHGGFATKETGQILVDDAYKKLCEALAAAEQQQAQPELSDEPDRFEYLCPIAKKWQECSKATFENMVQTGRCKTRKLYADYTG